MSKRLLDTDILSEIIKGKNAQVAAKAAAYLAAQTQFTISAISVAEVVFGFRRMGRDDRVAQFEVSLSTSPYLALALPALRRARKRAEEIAAATKTALIQVENGQFVCVDRRRRAAHARRSHDLDRAPPPNAEKRYRAALKHWDSYESWKNERNPARAELERAHGYDTKHAMHLIRLMRMGLEVLETGELHVRRDDADQLSAIRDGGLAFDDLLAMASNLQQSMEKSAAATTLPHDVDYDRVDALLADVLGIR